LGAEIEEDLGGGRRRGRVEQSRPSRIERPARTRRRRYEAATTDQVSTDQVSTDQVSTDQVSTHQVSTDQPVEEATAGASARTPRIRRRSRGGAAVNEPSDLANGGPLRPVLFSDGTSRAPRATGPTSVPLTADRTGAPASAERGHAAVDRTPDGADEGASGTAEGAPRRRRRRGPRGAGGNSAAAAEATVD
jgi:hypothetical protein